MLIKGVEVYGELQEDSSFFICCEDEEFDGVYADGNPNDAEYKFANWTDVVVHLLKEYRSDIVQIETD